MKKLINRPDRVVQEMMQGLAAIYPDVLLLREAQALIRADANELRDRQVALVSGGGSGHEPAHAGYVGAGMLTGALAGEVFTSPSPDAVFTTIRAVGGKAGVLLIVKNYTGDRLNFGLAAEMAQAEGIPVATVVVADDVAHSHAAEKPGARGLAGTVLVHKIAGAAAANGKSLSEVASVAQAAADEMATMGLALSAGIVPAVGKASFVLAADELELGLGIHGEPGVRRSLLRPADDLVDELIEKLLSARRWNSRERIAILVNNLGATTTMELAIVARRIVDVLNAREFVIERVYMGTFLTSLEAAGISLSLLRVDDNRLQLMDAPTAAPAWPNVTKEAPTAVEQRTISLPPPATDFVPAGTNRSAADSIVANVIRSACHAVENAEAQLTELDRLTGDGDLGTNLARGARAVEEQLSLYGGPDASETLQIAGRTLQRVVGGSSGAFYGILLLRMANSLPPGDVAAEKMWARAAMAACEAVSELGGARVGDRTMLDALLPFAESLNRGIDQHQLTRTVLERAVTAAHKGAEATSRMVPRFGRASYLGERAIGHPDAGAVAAAIWLQAVADAVNAR